MFKNIKLFIALSTAAVATGAVGFSVINSSKLDSASAITEPTAMTSGNSCYITPNSSWKESNAVFSMYFFNDSGNAWSNIMTAVDGNTDGAYQSIVPSGGPWTTCIAVRLKNGSTSGSWGNKWNQTGNLTLSGTNNGVQITDWNAGSLYAYAASDRADLYGTQLCIHTATECSSSSVSSTTWSTESSEYWSVMGADAKSYFTEATADSSITTGRTGGAARYDVIYSKYGYTNFASR